MRTIQSLLLPAAAAVCLTATAFAQTATTPAPAIKQAQAQPQGKQVKFTLQNTTKNTIALQSGTQQISLAAGQSKTVKAAAGTRIVTTAPSDAGQTGTVVAEVSDGMDGSTVNVR